MSSRVARGGCLVPEEIDVRHADAAPGFSGTPGRCGGHRCRPGGDDRPRRWATAGGGMGGAQAKVGIRIASVREVSRKWSRGWGERLASGDQVTSAFGASGSQLLTIQPARPGPAVSRTRGRLTPEGWAAGTVAWRATPSAPAAILARPKMLMDWNSSAWRLVFMPFRQAGRRRCDAAGRGNLSKTRGYGLWVVSGSVLANVCGFEWPRRFVQP